MTSRCITILFSVLLLFVGAKLKAQATDPFSISLDVPDEDGIFNNVNMVQSILKIQSNENTENEFSVEWSISTDTWKPLMNQVLKVKIKGNTLFSVYCPIFVYPGPGFYRVMAEVKSEKGVVQKVQQVIGIDPEKIQAQTSSNDDFEQFWSQSIAELKKVDPKYKVTPVKRDKTTKTDLYKVEMQSFGGLTVRGWLEVPKKKGKYPALLRVPGYTENMKPIDQYDDLIVFSFNTRDHGESDDTGPRGYDMWVRGMESAYDYYYRGIILDCLKAVDYLANRDDVDMDRLAVWGGSQGGGLSFFTAGLDQRIDLCIADVPYLCDMQNYFEITHWQEVDAWFESHPDQTWQSILNTWTYFDSKNLATKIKCPVWMGIGLQDDVCPPSTSFATYNFIEAPKKFTVYKYEYHWQPDIHYVNGFKELRKFFEMDK
ncbi:MAG: acetylxylan esterase [Reichenbachiella sp.]